MLVVASSIKAQDKNTLRQRVLDSIKSNEKEWDEGGVRPAICDSLESATEWDVNIQALIQIRLDEQPTAHVDIVGGDLIGGGVGTQGSPQNLQSQSDFEASPQYHEMLVGYVKNLQEKIPGISVDWDPRRGTINKIEFPGSYDETVAALMNAGYYTDNNWSNWAWNPSPIGGHLGGKEFRDPLSTVCETSFHFKLLYPYKTETRGSTLRGEPNEVVVRHNEPARATDVHIDRYSPISPNAGLGKHTRQVAGSVWDRLTRIFGSR